MLRNKMIEQYMSIIKSTLNQNKVVYIDNELSLIVKKFAQKREKILVIDNNSLSIESTDFNFIFIKYSNSEPIESLIKLIGGQDYSKKAKITIIVSSMQEKYLLDDYRLIYSIRKEAKNSIELGMKRKNFIDSSIGCRFCNQSEERKFNIHIGSRADCLENFMDEGAAGYIFTADLYDIVSIYNSIGDALFDCNVRYGIRDVSNVDKEIMNTLQNCPDKFWFYNNGITIVISDDSFILNRQNMIQLSTDKLLSFINGSQTITAASKFYYEKESGIEKESNNPKVLLRLINFREKQPLMGEVNSVTIALNRQKSINDEDIVFTYSFVNSINDIMLECEEKNLYKCFDLIKRGGDSYYKYSYGIREFAQIVKCYLGQAPGFARSNVNALIADVYDEKKKERTFKDKQIFKEITTVDDFLKYYSPVNFVFDLVGAYDKIAKSHSKVEDEHVLAIYNYGRWYFAALCVYLLNQRSVDDFRSFEYSMSNVEDFKILDNIVELFVELIKLHVDEDKKLDSNDFKTEELYNAIRKSDKVNSLEIALKEVFKNNAEKQLYKN